MEHKRLKSTCSTCRRLVIQLELRESSGAARDPICGPNVGETCCQTALFDQLSEFAIELTIAFVRSLGILKRRNPTSDWF